MLWIKSSGPGHNWGRLSWILLSSPNYGTHLSSNKATCHGRSEFYWLTKGELHRQFIIFFFLIKESECTTLIADGLGSDIPEVEEGREPLHWLIFWGRGQCEQIEILRGESIVQSRYYWLCCSCVTGGGCGRSSFQSVGQASPCPPTYSPSSVDPQGGPVLLESEAETLCFENIHFLS